jgi:hypothetical protein
MRACCFQRLQHLRGQLFGLLPRTNIDDTTLGAEVRLHREQQAGIDDVHRVIADAGA